MTIEISESAITQAVIDICGAHTGFDLELTPVEKVLPDDWGRNLVWRYRVRKASSDFPATLIVKVSKMGGGHVFLSAAYFRISHLSCINGSLIPLELQVEAEEAYFQALAPLIPDPATRQLDYAAAATTMLIWMLSIWLDKKDRRRHLATLRQRIFAALTLYTQHAFFTELFPHTAAALTRLHQKLGVRWTEEEKNILTFPVFQST